MPAYQKNSNEEVQLKIDDYNETSDVPKVFSHDLIETYVVCQWCHELCLHIEDHFCSHVECDNRTGEFK